MDSLTKILNSINNFVWGEPLVIFLLATGLFLTIRLKGLQFTKLLHSLYLAFIKRKDDEDSAGDISHFQALMTAMAATVGTGNIVGVAYALSIGGPGALFWMWMTGLVGMASKYGEAVLAVKYREQDAAGNFRGGPMYYIEKGLGWKWLALAFAFFASIAAFGIGNMTQSNSVAGNLETNFGVPIIVTGIVLAALTFLVIIGGIKSIAKVTSVMVPVMILVYLSSGIIILILNIDKIPEVMGLILSSAFSPAAATGGFSGAVLKKVIQSGVVRGLFSNESGLGSAPIAAATAKTSDPTTQALVSMTQTFIDTLIVCSLTGFVLIITGTWSEPVKASVMTSNAFTSGLGISWGGHIVSICLAFFAFSTIIGWSYYGEKAVEYLIGSKSIIYYRYIFTGFVFLGAVFELKLVWTVSEIFNAFMALPNLLALLLLSPIIVKETQDYLNKKTH